MTMNDTAQALQGAQDILILTHKRPDGDTVGSAAALCLALQGCGKRAFLHPNEDFTPKYTFLYEGLLAPQSFAPAFLVAVDIATEDLFPASANHYKGKVDLAIDHHGSHTHFAGQSLVDSSCGATGELIWQLAQALDYGPAPAFCQAIYTAIATDTGCFRYPNTTPQSHRIAALCMEQEGDFSAINRVFFDSKTPARFRVEQYLFEQLAFSAGGKIAAALFPQSAIDSCGATSDDLDNLSALPRQVQGVSCSIILTQVAPGQFKGSVRTDESVDASRLCAQFGGGGHPRAAGCTLSGDGPQILQQLVSAAQEALGYV